MQYTNENEISTACTVLTVFLIIKVQKSVKVVQRGQEGSSLEQGH